MTTPSPPKALGGPVSSIELHVFGRPEQRASVELEASGCAFCAFVHENIDMVIGGVVFIASPGDEEVRRIHSVLAFGGRVGLVCERVTAEQASAEIARASLGAALEEKPS